MDTLNNHMVYEIGKNLSNNDKKQFRLSSNIVNNSCKKDFHCLLLNEVLQHLHCVIDIIPELSIYDIISIFEETKKYYCLNQIEYIKAKYPKKNGWSCMLKNKYKHLKYLNIDPY